MLGVESIRTAQKKFGNKPLTGEQVRWGIENLDLSAARLKELGFEGMLQPLKVTCADHEGTRAGRIQQWDGAKWVVVSDWYQSDDKVHQADGRRRGQEVRGREEAHRPRLLEGELRVASRRASPKLIPPPSTGEAGGGGPTDASVRSSATPPVAAPLPTSPVDGEEVR